MNNVFEFKHNRTSYTGVKSEVVVKTGEECLPEIIESFEEFLKGCGFSLNGRHLELIDEEE